MSSVDYMTYITDQVLDHMTYIQTKHARDKTVTLDYYARCVICYTPPSCSRSESTTPKKSKYKGHLGSSFVLFTRK